MEPTFFATFKLITGEEVLAEVCSHQESGTDFFLVSNPITIEEKMTVDNEKGTVSSGMMPRKWLNYSNDDMVVINKSHVISMSEMDKFGSEFYNKALLAAKISSPIKRKVESKNNSGFVGKTESAREYIKRIFNKSPNLPPGSEGTQS